MSLLHSSYKHGQLHVNYLAIMFRYLMLYIIVQQGNARTFQSRPHVCTLPVMYDKLLALYTAHVDQSCSSPKMAKMYGRTT
jgi:hypothetical protein